VFESVEKRIATMSEESWKFEYHTIPKTLTESFKELFTGYDEGLVRMEPGGFVTSPTYAKHAEKIYRMKPRSEDVWLLTFPKCGE
jgi:estrone sulfotransferase